jgi:hypothetical protein
MRVPDITKEIEAIASRMIGQDYALDALWKIVNSLNEAAELIKVEMRGRIADGAIPSDEVTRGLGLQNPGG